MTDDMIRPSKAVLTYGAGSIIDLKGGRSAMVMSPDYWQKYEVLHEKRLADELKVDHFRSPSSGVTRCEGKYQNTGIRVRRFPVMWYCPKCRRLQHGDRCSECKHGNSHVETVPPRLIAACEGGHIEDFPWHWWVGCHEMSHVIELHPSKGESDLTVICPKCRQAATEENPSLGFRTLKGALGPLQLNCRGERPWIGDSSADEGCDRNLFGMMRSGSNVYFPLTQSSILIPQFSYRIYQKVISARDLELVRHGYEIAEGDTSSPIFIAILDKVISQYRKGYIEGENAEYTEEDFTNAFIQYCRPREGLSIKEEEWHSFVDPEPAPRKGDEVEFDAMRLNISSIPFLRQFFDRIILIKRLSEIRAQIGFTRINPVTKDMPKSSQERSKSAIANIREGDDARWQRIFDDMVKGDGKHRGYRGLLRCDDKGDIVPRDKRNWLPGVKNKGEGIFFVFNRERIERWEQDPCWTPSIKQMLTNGAESFIPMEEFDLDARGLLIHTFSHMLMRQLSQECGYSMASLRERLYVSKDKNMLGALIYTAAADFQGSLGGLIEQAADTSSLEEHIRAVIASARTCSQDPLCSMHDPKVTGKPWGAACHACLHVPETSCESLMNRFLDRHTIYGDGYSKKGYFQ